MPNYLDYKLMSLVDKINLLEFDDKKEYLCHAGSYVKLIIPR